jgi:hypothetical protein
MPLSPVLHPLRAHLVVLAPLVLLCGSAFGQSFSTDVANSNPLNLGAFIPVLGDDFGLGHEGAFKGAVYYGLGAKAEYDSNFFLKEDNEESELTALISPWLRYVSDPEGGASATLTVNYRPVLRLYVENTDFNGFDNTGDATLAFKGYRSELSIFARYSEMSGTDRLTGNFNEGWLGHMGFRFNRGLAPRTWMNAGWTYSTSDYGSSIDEGADIHTTYLGALWRATERVSLGSTLRYTYSESDNIGSIDAWALLFEGRYRVGERVFLSASLGPEFTEATDQFGATDDDIRLSGRIAARYVINERWSWENMIRTATIPSPNQVNSVVNDIMVSTGLTHQLQIGTLSGGLTYSYSDFENVAGGATREDEQNISIYLGYRRGFFSERLAFDTTVRYGLNDGQENWSQFFLSTGIGMAF